MVGILPKVVHLLVLCSLIHIQVMPAHIVDSFIHSHGLLSHGLTGADSLRVLRRNHLLHPAQTVAILKSLVSHLLRKQRLSTHGPFWRVVEDHLLVLYDSSVASPR